MNEDMELLDAEIDAAWEDQPIQEEPQQETQQDPEPQMRETQEQEEEKTETAAEPAPETFTVKNRDETRQVTRDELVAMAQKGWDYDTVRSERDQLRQYRTEADPALSLVRMYAERSGMTVTDYLDFCRKQELMGQGLNEQTAKAQIDLEKQKAALDTQNREAQEAQKRQEEITKGVKDRIESRNRDMNEFIKTYPNVKPEDIPKEVWEKMAGGMSLVTAYTMHQNQRLQTELAAQQQNKENKKKTTGSMSTAGEKSEMDDIDRWWNEDD